MPRRCEGTVRLLCVPDALPGTCGHAREETGLPDPRTARALPGRSALVVAFHSLDPRAQEREEAKRPRRRGNGPRDRETLRYYERRHHDQGYPSTGAQPPHGAQRDRKGRRDPYTGRAPGEQAGRTTAARFIDATPVPCQYPRSRAACSPDHGARWYSRISPPRTSRRRTGAAKSITRSGSWLGGCCSRP